MNFHFFFRTPYVVVGEADRSVNAVLECVTDTGFTMG